MDASDGKHVCPAAIAILASTWKAEPRMAKLHFTMTPGGNLLLILVWAATATLLFVFVEPHVPYSLAVMGGLLGIVGGLMQHRSMVEATKQFMGASSLLGVRGAFTSTKWGIRYIYWLYLCKAILLIHAFLMLNPPLLRVVVGYLAGYSSLMFAREVVTFRDMLAMNRLAKSEAGNGLRAD